MEHLKLIPAAASSQQSTGSSQNSKERKELILSCQKAIFGGYRTDQYADPEVFMVSLGAVLEQFPDEVITYISDPRGGGIQRRTKWPPTISEVVEACEQHQEFLVKVRNVRPVSFKERPAPLLQDRPQGYLATIFVPEGHVRYAKLVEWTKEARPVWWKFGVSSDNRKGLWVSRGAWEGTPEPDTFEGMKKAFGK
jgi:hypothetical protein